MTFCFSIYNKRELPKVSEGWGIGSFSRYDIIDQVGEGTYGQVYKAVKKDGMFAVLNIFLQFIF